MATKSVEAVLREKKIFQITNPKLVQAPPETTIESALKLMRENRSGYVVVAKNKKVVGLFTETEVVWKIMGEEADESRPIADFMTQDPFCLTPEDSVVEAMSLMRDHEVYHIPLINDKKELVNVLSVRTLIRFLAEFYPTEVYNLPPKPERVMETQEGG